MAQETKQQEKKLALVYSRDNIQRKKSGAKRRSGSAGGRSSLKTEIEEINLIWGEDISFSPHTEKNPKNRRRVSRENSAGRENQIHKQQHVQRQNHKLSRVESKKRKRTRTCIVRKKKIVLFIMSIGILICVLLIFTLKPPEWRQVDKKEDNGIFLSGLLGEKIQGIKASDYEKHPVWEENFLTINEYSRPGTPIGQVKNIFVHYTANPGTSAAQNRSYFEHLKDTHETSVSSHFIIGYDGEIIQCIPLDEMAYAVKSRNKDSISIECCYLEEDGSFTQETYDSLIKLLGWLADTYKLSETDILRHYDCGGKKCPLYYTENESEWEQLRDDMKSYRNR